MVLRFPWALLLLGLLWPLLAFAVVPPSSGLHRDYSLNEGDGTFACMMPFRMQYWLTHNEYNETYDGYYVSAINTNSTLGSVSTWSSAGGFSYATPDLDYFGTDSFTYTLTNGMDTVYGTAYFYVARVGNDTPSFTAGDDVTVEQDQYTTTPYDAAWATDIADGLGRPIR